VTAEAASTRRPVDLAVAVLTYNNADTITGVVTAAAEGLARHFPDLQGTLIAADAGSSDGTPALVEAAGLPVVATRYQPPAGERVSVPFHCARSSRSRTSCACAPWSCWRPTSCR
jgi:hypothetical protein